MVISCVLPLLLAIINLESAYRRLIHIDNQIEVREALKRKDLIFIDVRSPPREHHREKKYPVP